MSQLIKKTIYLSFCLLIFSCNTSDKKKKNSIESETSPKSYAYAIDTAGISVMWTAYKFTDKVGVSGTFDYFTFINKKLSNSVENILNKSELAIHTASVNSGNAIRDFKLNTYFFETFNTSVITGTILNIKEGEGVTRVNMNKTSYKIPFTYALENDTIIVFTHLDLKHWKGEEALATLNKEYDELHKGTDSMSKFWPDIDVWVKLPVIKTLMTD